MRSVVQEMHRRLFPYLETIKHSRMLNVWFADDSVIAEVQVVILMSDGRDGEFSLFAWLAFNGDLISGEGCYVDAEHGDLLSQILGASFFADPAVTRT